MTKKKLSREEGIAVSIALVVLLLFSPFFFNSLPNGLSGAPSNVPDSAIDEYYQYEQAILDFEVRDVVTGTGLEAEIGDVVYVHYVGMLPNGDKFDSSTRSETPFAVVLGAGQVITGWDLGLLGMREGGTRRLVIPPALAYGDQQITDTDGTIRIPANSTLHFDIVLLRVEK